MDCLKYQIPLLLLKELISAKQVKNEKLVNDMNDGLIDLRNAINRKKIHKNENQEKLVNIVEKIFHFNKRQKGKGLFSEVARGAMVSDREFFYCM